MKGDCLGMTGSNVGGREYLALLCLLPSQCILT